MNNSQTSQSTESIIIFASPQILTGSIPITMNSILLDMNKSAPHMIVMNKVHIVSQFGHRSSVGTKV